VTSKAQPVTAAAVAASQRGAGAVPPGRHHGQDPGEDRRRADGDDRPDGDAGADGRGEEGCLVRGGGRRAGDEQEPGARPAGDQAAQRRRAAPREEAEDGTGLQGMADRLAALGGTLRIRWQAPARQNSSSVRVGGDPGGSGPARRTAARRAFFWDFSITDCDAFSELAGFPAGRGRSRPALNGGAHASAACTLLSVYVRRVADQVKRMSSQRATTPICPE
jgi:hypothetical protein